MPSCIRLKSVALEDQGRWEKHVSLCDDKLMADFDLNKAEITHSFRQQLDYTNMNTHAVFAKKEIVPAEKGIVSLLFYQRFVGSRWRFAFILNLSLLKTNLRFYAYS
jgi:hypothetical protein